MWGKVWSNDDVAELRRHLDAGLGYEAIARLMQRPPGGVKTKIKRISSSVTRKRMPWTKEECDTLLNLKDRYGMRWEEIARRLNKPCGSVYSKYTYLKNQARLGPRHVEDRLSIPVSTAQEWERRMLLSPRDITSAVFGDPLPGCSALERRAS